MFISHQAAGPILGGVRVSGKVAEGRARCSMDFGAERGTVAPGMTQLMSPSAAIGLLLISLVAPRWPGWSQRGPGLLAGSGQASRCFPATKPRVIPWGIGSVLAVIVAYGVINIAVSVAYLSWTGSLRAGRKPR